VQPRGRASKRQHLTFGLWAAYTPTVTPTTPCGACRRVLAEFGPTAAVHCFCDAPAEVGNSTDKLLPSAFTVGDLHRATTP